MRAEIVLYILRYYVIVFPSDFHSLPTPGTSDFSGFSRSGEAYHDATDFFTLRYLRFAAGLHSVSVGSERVPLTHSAPKS